MNLEHLQDRLKFLSTLKIYAEYNESRKIKTKTDNNKGKFININNFLLVNLSIKKPDIIKVNTDKVE